MGKPHRDITLAQLRYFVRTAELGSMTEAAAEMYVAQSAVSAAISHLEQSVDSQLLIRHRSKGVAITEQGKNFYQAAKTVLAAVDDAIDVLHPGRLAGSFAAGCFTTLAHFWLPEIHDGLAADHPALDVTILEMTADQIHSALQRREIEVALTYHFDLGPEITFEKLCDARTYAVVSEHSPLANRQSVSLEDLAEERLMLLDVGKASEYFLTLFRDAGIHPQVHRRFESVEVLRAMVARGHGYTILSQRPAHDLTNDGRRIVRLELEGVRSFLQIGIAHRVGEALSRKGEAFLAQCRKVLGA